jgi:uncharacterized delta-60 repeat protein
MKNFIFLIIILAFFNVSFLSQSLKTESLLFEENSLVFGSQERGNLDTTFGVNGKTTAKFSLNEHRATDSFIQPDGKIVVVGNTAYSMLVARFNKDGSLDAAFGDSGKVTISNQPEVYAETAVLQSDGKIVMVCSKFPNYIVLFRLNANGSFDSSFGVDGVTAYYQDGIYRASAKLQADGKIVVGSWSYSQGSVVRFSSNGILDQTFGENGIASISFTVNDLAIQNDGKIIAVGQKRYLGVEDFALSRLNSDGALDLDFGTEGTTVTDFDSKKDTISSVAIQDDGKIVVGGYSDNAGDFSFALARYNQNGYLDLNFNSTGKVVTRVFRGRIFSVALQPDGKIIAAGEAFNHFGVIRYNSDGTIDTFSEPNNKMSYYPQLAVIGFDSSSFNVSSFESVTSIKLQTDGKLVVAGDSYRGSENSFFAVIRLNPNPIVQTRSIKGRFLNFQNRGVSRVMVRIQNHNTGEYFYTITNFFGYFSFSNLPLNHNFTITAEKRNRYVPFLNLQLTEETADIIFQTNL